MRLSSPARVGALPQTSKYRMGLETRGLWPLLHFIALGARLRYSGCCGGNLAGFRISGKELVSSTRTIQRCVKRVGTTGALQ